MHRNRAAHINPPNELKKTKIPDLKLDFTPLNLVFRPREWFQRILHGFFLQNAPSFIKIHWIFDYFRSIFDFSVRLFLVFVDFTPLSPVFRVWDLEIRIPHGRICQDTKFHQNPTLGAHGFGGFSEVLLIRSEG